MQQLEFDFVKEFYGEGEPAEIPYDKARMIIVENPAYNVYALDSEKGKFVLMYMMDKFSYYGLINSGADIYLSTCKEREVEPERILNDMYAYRIVR